MSSPWSIHFICVVSLVDKLQFYASPLQAGRVCVKTPGYYGGCRGCNIWQPEQTLYLSELAILYFFILANPIFVKACSAWFLQSCLLLFQIAQLKRMAQQWQWLIVIDYMPIERGWVNNNRVIHVSNHFRGRVNFSIGLKRAPWLKQIEDSKLNLDFRGFPDVEVKIHWQIKTCTVIKTHWRFKVKYRF